MTRPGEYGETCNCGHYSGEHFTDGSCAGEQIPQPASGPTACPCEAFQ